MKKISAGTALHGYLGEFKASDVLDQGHKKIRPMANKAKVKRAQEVEAMTTNKAEAASETPDYEKAEMKKAGY